MPLKVKRNKENLIQKSFGKDVENSIRKWHEASTSEEQEHTFKTLCRKGIDNYHVSFWLLLNRANT